MRGRLLLIAVAGGLLAVTLTSCQSTAGNGAGTPGGTSGGGPAVTADSVSGTVPTAVLRRYGVLRDDGNGGIVRPPIDRSTGHFSGTLQTPANVNLETANGFCSGATATPSTVHLAMFDYLRAGLGTQTVHMYVGDLAYAASPPDPSSGPTTFTAWVYADAASTLSGTCPFRALSSTFQLTLKKGWNTVQEVVSYDQYGLPSAYAFTDGTPSSGSTWVFLPAPHAIYGQYTAPVGGVTNTGTSVPVTPLTYDGKPADPSPSDSLASNGLGGYDLSYTLPTTFPAVTTADIFDCPGGTLVPKSVTLDGVYQFQYHDNNFTTRTITAQGSALYGAIVGIVYASEPAHFDATCTDPVTGAGVAVNVNLAMGWNYVDYVPDTGFNTLTIIDDFNGRFTWGSN